MSHRRPWDGDLIGATRPTGCHLVSLHKVTRFHGDVCRGGLFLPSVQLKGIWEVVL